ncbi:MAG: glycosyltransferase [Chloroflexota bacterium]|nr:MAG: glycosyltransferase [Chloroflexota bacterium]
MHVALLTSSYPAAPDDIALPFLPSFRDAVEARGHRVTVIAPDRRAQRGTSSTGIIWYPWLGGTRAVIDLAGPSAAHAVIGLHLFASGFLAAASLHARDPIDVALAAFVIPSGAIALALRSAFGIPYATWALGSDISLLTRYAFGRRTLRWILCSAAARFADGPGLANRVVEIGQHPCAFMPTARLLDVATPPTSLPGDRRHVLYVGRLTAVKGFDLLVSAFEGAAVARPDLTLHVVGDGDQMNLAHDLRDRLGPERVHVHGRLDRSGVAEIMRAADVLVMPSRSDSIPTTLIEAGSLGLPVIAAAVGDIPAVVSAHDLGVLCPANDRCALELAIVNAKKRSIGPENVHWRESLARQFGPDTAADIFLTTLGEIRGRRFLT